VRMGRMGGVAWAVAGVAVLLAAGLGFVHFRETNRERGKCISGRFRPVRRCGRFPRTGAASHVGARMARSSFHKPPGDGAYDPDGCDGGGRRSRRAANWCGPNAIRSSCAHLCPAEQFVPLQPPPRPPAVSGECADRNWRADRQRDHELAEIGDLGLSSYSALSASSGSTRVARRAGR
jgi:hypothetical protein